MVVSLFLKVWQWDITQFQTFCHFPTERQFMVDNILNSISLEIFFRNSNFLSPTFLAYNISIFFSYHTLGVQCIQFLFIKECRKYCKEMNSSVTRPPCIFILSAKYQLTCTIYNRHLNLYDFDAAGWCCYRMIKIYVKSYGNLTAASV